MHGCCNSTNFCEPRNFLTREEKIEILKEYKESLENEVMGIMERIGDLEKN